MALECQIRLSIPALADRVSVNLRLGRRSTKCQRFAISENAYEVLFASPGLRIQIGGRSEITLSETEHFENFAGAVTAIEFVYRNNS